MNAFPAMYERSLRIRFPAMYEFTQDWTLVVEIMNVLGLYVLKILGKDFR